MDPIQNKFFDIIDNAVALNIEYQLKFEDSKRYIAPAQWLHDFGTVNLNTGRGTGKTLYITKRMKPCDVVIVALEQDVKDYYRILDQKVDNVHSARLIFDRFNMVGYWRGRRDVPEYFNKVYVDESGRVFSSKGSQYEFYNWFGPRCNQVIMLGSSLTL